MEKIVPLEEVKDSPSRLENSVTVPLEEEESKQIKDLSLAQIKAHLEERERQINESFIQLIPQASRSILIDTIQPNELIEKVGVSSYFRLNAVLIILSICGTIFSIIMTVLVILGKGYYWYLITLGIPGLLVYFLYHFLCRKPVFYVITDQRVLLFDGQRIKSIPHSNIVSIKSQFNWLFCMKELVIIKRKSPLKPKFRENVIEGLTEETMVEFQTILNRNIKKMKNLPEP